jgi:hypothetical protein
MERACSSIATAACWARLQVDLAQAILNSSTTSLKKFVEQKIMVYFVSLLELRTSTMQFASLATTSLGRYQHDQGLPLMSRIIAHRQQVLAVGALQRFYAVLPSFEQKEMVKPMLEQADSILSDVSKAAEAHAAEALKAAIATLEPLAAGSEDGQVWTQAIAEDASFDEVVAVAQTTILAMDAKALLESTEQCIQATAGKMLATCASSAPWVLCCCCVVRMCVCVGGGGGGVWVVR